MKKITNKLLPYKELFKLKNFIRNLKSKAKIRTRLLKILNFIHPLGKVNSELMIFDDFFPHSLSPFRYTEYSEYLKHFEKIKIVSNGISLNCISENSVLSEVIDEYLNTFPLFKTKLEVYNARYSYKSKLIYVTFLGNVVHFDLGYSLKIPFIVNLYPGGMLQTNNKKIDNYLKKYLCSPYCKKVIVTQDYVYNYLISNKLCSEEKIEFIFGVVTPPKLLDINIKNKRRYGFHKKTLDVCFVAHQYTKNGADKGYDKFIESARILVKKHNNIKLHVVGPFSSNTINIQDIEKKIEFYGSQPTDWFEGFYKNKDVIISPNIPFILSPGGFDGFPTAAVTEAGLNELIMLVTDELEMNKNKFEDGKEIVIIQPNSKSIVEKIEFCLKNPDKIKSISELGALKIKDLYSHEKQIDRRINIIQHELDKLS